MFNYYQSAIQTNILFNDLIAMPSLDDFEAKLDSSLKLLSESLDKNEYDEDIIFNRLNELDDVFNKWKHPIFNKYNTTFIKGEDINMCIQHDIMKERFKTHEWCSITIFFKHIKPFIESKEDYLQCVKEYFFEFYIDKKIRKMPSYLTEIQIIKIVRSYYLKFYILNNYDIFLG